MAKKIDVKKQRFEALVNAGYTKTEAHHMKYWKTSRVKEAITKAFESKAELHEAKPAKKVIRQIARFMGFAPHEADRVRNLNLSNIVHTFKTGRLEEAGAYIASRAKDHIEYKEALDSQMLIHRARYGSTMYLYQVEYKILSEVAFFRDKKYVTVTSSKKLTKKQVFEKVLNDIFPKHDDDYGTVPDPTSLKLTNAYYMTPSQYKKLLKDRATEK